MVYTGSTHKLVKLNKLNKVILIPSLYRYQIITGTPKAGYAQNDSVSWEAAHWL